MSVSQRLPASKISQNSPSSATPALLKSTVARPCCAATSSAKVLTRASSATFTTCCVTLPLGEPSSAAVSANPFSSTSEIASDAPIPANCCARHRPIPDPAPVITATPSLRSAIGTPARLDSQPSYAKTFEPHYYHNSPQAASAAVTRDVCLIVGGN